LRYSIGAGLAIKRERSSLVSRARRSTQWCDVDPGPSFLHEAKESNRGPGSAPHHFAALMLQRIRGTGTYNGGKAGGGIRRRLAAS
jgi:hypothetical protein